MATSSGDVGDYGVRVDRKYLYTCTYKASERKRAIIRRHCATSKSSVWYMDMYHVAVPLNAHASIVQIQKLVKPHIIEQLHLRCYMDCYPAYARQLLICTLLHSISAYPGYKNPHLSLPTKSFYILD